MDIERAQNLVIKDQQAVISSLTELVGNLVDYVNSASENRAKAVVDDSEDIGHIKVDNRREQQEVYVRGNLKNVMLITRGKSTIRLHNAYRGDFAIGLENESTARKNQVVKLVREFMKGMD